MKQLATDNIEELLEKDRFVEGKIIHKIFLYFSVVYMAFGIADFFYASEKFWQFLALRAVYCLVPISIYFVIDRTKSFRQTEYFAFVHAGIAAGIISYMIFSTSGVNSPYYAGLNLVGLIGLCFFTFSWSFFWLTTGVIYLPYYLLSFAFHSTTEVVTPLILNSFFIVGDRKSVV